MTDDATRSHEPRDRSLERLRRWSTAPPSLTAEQAARRVRGRLPRHRRSARQWRSIAAALAVPAVIAAIVAGIWLRSPPPPHADDPRGTEQTAVGVADGALVVVPLRSGTVLYIAPHIAPHPTPRAQGETDEAALPGKEPEASEDPSRRGSGPGRLHSRPRS